MEAIDALLDNHVQFGLVTLVGAQLDEELKSVGVHFVVLTSDNQRH